ncbi:MAG: hypothetical protein GTN49_03640 [candidate division Zixibacteria bacterium]|nr:hypothetical protein [candidate division Zixibacteria bacterium]
MGKTFLAAIAVVGAGALLVACGQKAAEGPSAEELRGELAGITEELNAYMDGHHFSNTDPSALQGAVGKFAEKFGALAGQAGKLRADTKDAAYDDVIGLAGEGRDKAGTLAKVLAAGAPMGDAAKTAALDDAIGDWADYNDRVGAPPGEAEPAPPPVVGEPAPPPVVGEPAPAPDEPGVPPEPGEPDVPPGPGEPDVPPEPGEPGIPPEPGKPGEPGGAPRYPGRGHHYGWWKNPEWARDRGTRPITEGEKPGVGEKERERERERDRAAKGKGPERKREREREHVAPGAGEGAAPGAGVAPGRAGGKGKGAGGSGKGGGADDDADKGAGGGKGRGRK